MSKMVTYTPFSDFTVIKMDDGKANAFSFEMIDQVNAALDRADQDNLICVLTGREGIFCAGFDLETMKAGGEKRDRLLHAGFSVSYRLLNSPRPVVLASSGHALAMGGILLLSADLRIGEDSNAKIGLNEIAIGVEMPSYGVDLVKERVALPSQIPALANSVLYKPQEATSVGFLDKVVEPGTLMDEAQQIASLLSKIDMGAHVLAKRALRRDFLAKYKEYGSYE